MWYLYLICGGAALSPAKENSVQWTEFKFEQAPDLVVCDGWVKGGDEMLRRVTPVHV